MNNEMLNQETEAETIEEVSTITKQIYYQSSKLFNAALITFIAFMGITSIDSLVNLIRDIYFLSRYMGL